MSIRDIPSFLSNIKQLSFTTLSGVTFDQSLVPVRLRHGKGYYDRLLPLYSTHSVARAGTLPLFSELDLALAWPTIGNESL
jgi:5-formyltetrahydrofolate cyclo-ligase